RYPNDGQRVFDHAQSVYWVGYIARRRGRAQDAEASFRKYLELAQNLVGLDADNLDWRIEKAFAHQNLGVVHLENFRSAEALKSFVETRETWLGAVPARPELNI